MSDEAAARFSKAHGTSNKTSLSREQDTSRRLTQIEPGKLFKSFRRIINGDFTGVVDRYHKNTEEEKWDPLHNHFVRVNDTLDAIHEEQQYLAMNMTSLGTLLDSFICTFFDQHWKSEVQRIVRTPPAFMRIGRRTNFQDVGPQSWKASDSYLERMAMASLFGQEILGRLDFLDLSTPDPVIAESLTVMRIFFDKFSPQSIMYFTPSAMDEKKDNSRQQTNM